MIDDEIREVMNLRQASRYMGISNDAMYAYAMSGTVPAFKLGNRWKFKKSLLDEWMDKESNRKRSKSK